MLKSAFCRKTLALRGIRGSYKPNRYLQCINTSILALLIAVALVLAGCGSDSDDNSGDGTGFGALTEESCANLANFTIDAADIDLPTSGAGITGATWDPANNHCEVVGRINPVDPDASYMEFQVNLPSAWNNRAVQFGGGGYDGSLVTGLGSYSLQPDGQATPLEQGFVTLGSDGGHQGGAGFDASFGLNDEDLLNYGQQSVKKTHDAAMALMEHVYGQGPDYFYFIGFSQGGHEALDAAARYPQDYDGVVSGTPSYNVTMMHIGIGLRHRDILYANSGAGWINPAKAQLIVDAVYDQCDGLDGLEDGIVSDPAGCEDTFDITPLRCAGGADLGDTCLSDAQIDSANAIGSDYDLGYAIAGNSIVPRGPIFSGGQFGFGLGGTAQPSDPATFADAWHYITLDACSRYIVTRTPTLDVLNWDPSNWIVRIQEVGKIMDVTDVSLKRFKDKGGKILLTAGSIDDGITPYNVIQYYERQVDQFGESEVDSFLKFYVIPGFSHGSGIFNASYDALPAMMAWVEDGVAPQGLVTTDTNAATLGRTRPLCDYPTWPQYDGSGDVNDAASFTCAE